MSMTVSKTANTSLRDHRDVTTSPWSIPVLTSSPRGWAVVVVVVVGGCWWLVVCCWLLCVVVGCCVLLWLLF